MRHARGGRLPRALLAVVVLLGGVACVPTIGGPTPPTRFYLLRPLEPPPDRSDGPRLGVGPVRLADYLDRPQIITRRGEHGVDLAEFDRWAEPLADSVARALAANLGSLLGTEQVQQHPFARVLEVELMMEIRRFDGPPSGPVELVAYWRLRRAGRVVERVSRLSQAQDGSGYEAQVAAMSRALQRLSREIAAALPSAPVPADPPD